MIDLLWHIRLEEESALWVIKDGERNAITIIFSGKTDLASRHSLTFITPKDGHGFIKVICDLQEAL